MRLDFPQSPRSTLGIEWELMCVDRRSGELRPAAPEILSRVNGDVTRFPHATVEFQTNTVEIASAPHERVADAVADLRKVLADVQDAAEPLGIDMIGGATHPFAQWFRQHVTPHKPRYDKIIDRAQWWARQMMIWGVHVHVGIEDRDKAIPILNALLTYFPHFQALSASSPFWASERTGYASNRALIYQQLPTAGLPPIFRDWDEYEGMVGDLIRTDVIDDSTELRWDIRPSSRWGTLEVRIFDGVATIEEVSALAALTQCVVEDLSSRIDAGESPEVLQHWFIRENKWRAARYGLDAKVILDRAGDQGTVRDELRSLVQRLEPTAARLGCLDELRSVLSILEMGAGYQRQLAAADEMDGSLKAVVAHLAAEMRDGMPRD